MGALLHRWGWFCTRHARAVLAAWLVGAALIAVVVSQVGARTDNDLSLPGTDSQHAFDLLAEQFPPQQNGTSPIVFHATSGKVTDAEKKKAIQQAVSDIAKREHVASVTDPFANAQAGLVSKDERTAFAPVLLDESTGDLEVPTAQDVFDTAGPAAAYGLEIEAGGPIGSTLSEPDTESSEAIGLLAAMVILTLVLGSLIAMGLPILTALIGLGVALGGVGLLGHLVNIPSIGPTLATMIGLGVGIDYALFLVSKHRTLLSEGHPVDESVARTISTSGGAVVFAGGTVVVAMLSLAVAGIPFVTSLGIACAVAVLAAVVASITLLPAMLALVGTRIAWLGVPSFLRRTSSSTRAPLWTRWAGALTRHPWVFTVVSLAILVPLIIPMFSLRLGQEDVGVTPTSTTERRAFDLMSADFGPGYNGALVVATELDPVATPSKEYTDTYDQAMAMKSDLETKQKLLTQESNSLKAQQKELEAQQAELESEKARLEKQKTALEKQKASLERRAAALKKERAELKRERTALKKQARALAADIRASVRELAADERALGRNLADQKLVEDAIDAASDPTVIAALEADLAELQQAEAALRSSISGTRADLKADRAKAKQLAKQARALARQAEQLAKQAAALQSDRNDLEAQAASLQRQADALTAQATNLRASAAQLQQQADDLKAQSDAAKKEQKQAEKLQSQLTDELTKAGGDARGTDPRLVAEQDALIGIGTAGGVQVVGPPRINKSGSAAYFSVVPTTRPADPATADLVGHLREYVLPPVVEEQGLASFVGGNTASNVDLAAMITERLPRVIITVLLLSFLLLLLAFRSLLIPLQAAVTNLLSVAAAFGVLTACFQWGWGLDLIGLDSPYGTVPIASYVPLMMFAALFGLSMDYEVFLVSQIQHAHAHGASAREAVRLGLAASAKVVVAAALIMISVFGSFVLNGDPIVKQFGVGLAVAVLLAGASVLVLAPALLVLFGNGTFWLPGVLDRVLPHLHVEGAPENEDADEPTTGEPLAVP